MSVQALWGLGWELSVFQIPGSVWEMKAGVTVTLSRMAETNTCFLAPQRREGGS